MLTDKHIEQWTGYLIEELPKWKELEKILHENPEIDEVFIAMWRHLMVRMYKKGYQDCKDDNNT